MQDTVKDRDSRLQQKSQSAAERLRSTIRVQLPAAALPRTGRTVPGDKVPRTPPPVNCNVWLNEAPLRYGHSTPPLLHPGVDFKPTQLLLQAHRCGNHGKTSSQPGTVPTRAPVAASTQRTANARGGGNTCQRARSHPGSRGIVPMRGTPYPGPRTGTGQILHPVQTAHATCGTSPHRGRHRVLPQRHP